MSAHEATAPASVPLPAAVRRTVTAGLPLALLSAAILSFQGLYTLARAVCWTPKIAWLFPISIDVAASIATVASPPAHKPVRRHAARIALTVIAMSVAGNAAAYLIEGYTLPVTPLLVVIVTSVPPIVVALLVHLAMALLQAGETSHGQATGTKRQEAARSIGDAVGLATAMLDDERRAGRDPDRLTSAPLACELGCTASYARRILRIAHGHAPMPGNVSLSRRRHESVSGLRA